MEKHFLSPKEASVYTGISVRYLYQLIREKKISHSRPSGKMIFLEKKDLDSFVMSNKIIAESK